MDRLLFPDDIAERYHCSKVTARSYMKRMLHQEKPLAVTEMAVVEWEASRTVAGSADVKKARQCKTYKPAPTEFHVPRKRTA